MNKKNMDFRNYVITNTKFKKAECRVNITFSPCGKFLQFPKLKKNGHNLKNVV